MILHITARDAWDAAQGTGAYRAESLETEGFIHCSAPEQVTESAVKYYRGRDDLVLLVIDPARLQSELRVEAAKNGALYPHIYGPLNVDAVTAVVPFPPLPDGAFALPELPPDETPGETNAGA